VAVPFDDGWRLTVDGMDIAGRRAFGSTMAFDIPDGGSATLKYNTPITRRFVVLLQAVAWGLLLLWSSRLQPVVWWRRRRAETLLLDDSTLFDLDVQVPPELVVESDDEPADVPSGEESS
jgi:hypothetical protein